MKTKSFMLIAGEASGDALAAELVGALRVKVLERDSATTDAAQPLHTPLAPEFFGAGGPRMATAGVKLTVDLTRHSVLGVSDVLKNLRKFRRMFHELRRLAIERQPDVIIGVDYGGFNLRFAKAVRHYVRQHHSEFTPWNPKLVQFVSPQVWASRPGRARLMEKNHDLVLCLFPFEKAWYAEHAPKLRVELVGHPLTDTLPAQPPKSEVQSPAPRIVFLPGSRRDEVRRHWPVVTGAIEMLRREWPALHARVVLASEDLERSARMLGVPEGVEVQIGGAAAALAEADLAITKSGTITMECAAAGVPAVVFYRTSWATYWSAKQVVKVKNIAMPNLLAGEEVFPELIQGAATAERVAHTAQALLRDDRRRQQIRAKLARVIATLGGPGANRRAAEAIVSLLR